MKKLIIIMVLLAVLGGCSGAGKSNYRGNATKLKESPCAGCWDEEEVIELKLTEGADV